MRAYADGKIFFLHANEQAPMVSFLFIKEASRIMNELKAVGIDCHVKEISCYGTDVQAVFILMHGHTSEGLSLAFTSFKPAKIMRQKLHADGSTCRVSAVSCFDVMRNQTIAKYKLKFATPPADKELFERSCTDDFAQMLLHQ